MINNDMSQYGINNQIESPIQSHIYDHSDMKRLCELATNMGIAIRVERLHIMHVPGVATKGEKWIPDLFPKWDPAHKYSLILIGSEFEFFKDDDGKQNIRPTGKSDYWPYGSEPYPGPTIFDGTIYDSSFLDTKVTGPETGRPYRPSYLQNNPKGAK